MSMLATALVPAKRVRAVLVAMALCGLCASAVLAQTAQPPAAEPPPAQSQEAPQPPPSPPSAGGGGLLEKLGDLIRDSAEGVSSGLKGTQQRIDDINKGTIDTL